MTQMTLDTRCVICGLSC